MKFYLDIPIVFHGNIQRTFDLIVPEGKPEDIPLLIWIHGFDCIQFYEVLNKFISEHTAIKTE